ncbi:related to PTC5 - putative 2C protein phosphatase (PP2Cs) [Pseudozyma flocculosa]|uniref:Related to PTC5 - putative 2C protein phosphatase (PP2Cs) n=1 Tax=Pseudozyma flocculosa TaxID=84751 RepID=A0A5C3EW70_9BASI|nr:related to PTC5 - putative 2C protein phosphatase (PP2Cs) [Pseudozyma flocculosa]
MVAPRILSGCPLPRSRLQPATSSRLPFLATSSSPQPSSAPHCPHRPRLTPLPRSLPSTSNAFSTSTPSSRPSSGSKQQWKPPTPSATAYQKQSRKEWVLVGVAGSAAAVGSWYYWSNIRPRHQAAKKASLGDSRPFSLTADVRTSFSIPVRNHQVGGPTTKVISTLSSAEVDRRLTENERSTRVDRPPGACLVARYDTNSVASNDPIEDKRAEVIVERDRGVAECDRPSDISGSDGAHKAVGATASVEEAQSQAAGQPAKGDLCFFAVMDGHAGYHTSTLLSQKLIAFVALELDKVFREAGEYGQVAKAKAAMPSKLWRSIFGGPANAASAGGLDGDPEVIKRAIAKAFRSLDKEIVNTPVELLKEYELSLATTSSSSASPASPSRVTGATGTRSLSSLAHSIFPTSSNATFTATQKSAYESILPALSGSCALLTYVDSAREDVYVACTGDSRAIAGYWDDKAGKWEVEALSVDQTGRNPDEVKRMKSEHPASESEHVIMRGRVLGGLEPTRAFGDARYKWDRDLQGRLYDAFLPGGRASTRGPPRGLETPPYVTATPVVEWRRVGASSSSPSRELRFVVMATDGLWDMVSNEEVVGLVAGHLAGVKGTILATDLHRQCFEASNQDLGKLGQATPEQQLQLANAKQHPLSKGPEELKAFTFQDDNLSTHLIRNALGGANQQRVSGLLAIPSPESRRYRDDVTVNVILFNSPRAGAASTSTTTAAVAAGAAGAAVGDADSEVLEGRQVTPQGASLPNVAQHGDQPKAKL